jgi:hypothetical protein
LAEALARLVQDYPLGASRFAKERGKTVFKILIPCGLCPVYEHDFAWRSTLCYHAHKLNHLGDLEHAELPQLWHMEPRR